MSHITNCPPHHALPSPDPYIVSADSRWRHPNPAYNLKSEMHKGSVVTFPEFTGERIYMQPFMKVDGEVLLPSKLSRWIPTVTAMLKDIDTTQRMFLMIDQSPVEPGKSHRRPGPHIDGNWSDKASTVFDSSELLILASDVEGCAAYIGSYEASYIDAGGDCSRVPLDGFKRVKCKAGFAYIGTVATIHESIPIKKACNRTLVRINVPLSV